jgi:hypothetical protein
MVVQMLNRSVSAGFVFLALMSPAAVAQSQQEFRGGGFITDFNSVCTQLQGWSGTQQFTIRARPAGVPGNDPIESSISIFLGEYVMHYRFNQEPFGSGGFTTANRFGSIGSGIDGDPQVMPRLRQLPTPAGTVFGGDNAFHVVAEIENFNGATGCVARLNYWLRRH